MERAVAEGLERRGIDVTTTHGSGLLSVADEVQLDFATSHDRVLFTHNADLLRLGQAGFRHKGIAYGRKGSRSIVEIVHGLVLIWEVLEPEDMD